MNLDDWHLLFVSICVAIILIACVPIVMAFIPSRDEPFLALAILGKDGMAESYYPDDDPNIELGEMVHWTIYLSNHMGEVQYVAVKVKLLNSTNPSPISNSCTPSPAPMIYEVRRVLMKNETGLFLFSWSILDAAQNGDFLEIRALSVNGETIETNALAIYGSDYRVVLELWVFNKNLNEFEFGWDYDDEKRCAWNQIWFNVINE